MWNYLIYSSQQFFGSQIILIPALLMRKVRHRDVILHAKITQLVEVLEQEFDLEDSDSRQDRTCVFNHSTILPFSSFTPHPPKKATLFLISKYEDSWCAIVSKWDHLEFWALEVRCGKVLKIPGIGRVPDTQKSINKCLYCGWEWDGIEEEEDEDKE